MYLRNSAKAVIVKDDKILCIKCKDDWGFFYLLPGGGQEPGETLPDAVRRECREEIGADVIVHDLIFVRDYISANHEFAEYESELHQIELMFKCELIEGRTPKCGITPDKDQIGIEWLNLDELENYRLYPMALRTFLKEGKYDSSITYLGDINSNQNGEDVSEICKVSFNFWNCHFVPISDNWMRLQWICGTHDSDGIAEEYAISFSNQRQACKNYAYCTEPGCI